MTSEPPGPAPGPLERLLQALKGGGSWVERRDAADALTLALREGILALRGAAGDPDPDVAHACEGALAAVREALKLDLERLSAAVQTHRRTQAAPAGTASAESAPVSAATPAEIEGWIEALARTEGAELRREAGRLSLRLSLPGQRAQTVFIDLNQTDSAGEPLALLYTLCGPPEEWLLTRALELNARLSHAAFALLKRDERRMFILVSRRRRAGLTPEELAKDLRYLASVGDQAEAQLHGADRH